MSDGFTTNPAELRAHAANVDTVRERFGNVKAASAHIAQDDQAYGVLCGWISGVLEARHQKQDELLGRVEENLSLVATSLRDTADDYETHEQGVVGVMDAIGDDLGSVVPR